jgi:hypothetical protein
MHCDNIHELLLFMLYAYMFPSFILTEGYHTHV